MKKITLLVLAALLLLGSCANDDPEVEIWTVASEKGITGVPFGFGFVPAYLVKRDDNSRWEALASDIAGFTFTSGYECRMRVRIDRIANPPADGQSVRYTMEQLISRTPAQSVDKADYGVTLDLRVASRRGSYYGYPCYWVKDMRYGANARWEPMPLDIAGFDFEPGHEYRLLVSVSAEQQAEGDNYIAAFSLAEVVETAETTSEGLPADS